MGAWSNGNTITHDSTVVTVDVLTEDATSLTVRITRASSAGPNGKGDAYSVKVRPKGTSGYAGSIVKEGPSNAYQQGDGGSNTVTVTIPVSTSAGWELALFASYNRSAFDTDWGGGARSIYDPTLTSTPPAASNLPILFGDAPVAIDPAVSTAAVLPSGEHTQPLAPWDSARDLADRAGAALRDYGDGTFQLEPSLPQPQTPVLTLYPGAGGNLLSCDSDVDVDTSNWAQQVRLTYSPFIAFGLPPGVEAEAMSSPSHGLHTLDVDRAGAPVNATLAQQTANTLGARAWLRGRTLRVTCPVAWWVRPTHTVRLTVPGGTPKDYWVATVRHDRHISTLELRDFTLSVYPIE